MTARWRMFWRSGLTAIGLSCAWSAFAQDSLDLTLSEARAVARNALQTGEAALARDLAMGLLQADPEDAYAYAVLASAHSQLGNAKLARSAARLTYKHSDTDANKFTAARAAGQLAFDQERMTPAQVWLRRAAVHAETDSQEKVLKRDYANVRAQNPWRFSIKGNLTPSSNLNNGSDSEQVYVNGVLQNVTLGASSQALSGLVGSLDGQVSYRLRHTENTRTTLGTRLYTRRVRLSDEARDTAPALSNSDFGVTYVDASLDHAFALGAPGNTAGVRGTIGAVWVAGDHSYSFSRLGVRRGIKVGDRGRLNFSLSGEWRESEVSSQQDSQQVRFSAGYALKLESGDTISFSVRGADISGDLSNSTYKDTSLRFGYAFGKQIGPAQIEAGITLGQVDYSTYVFATGSIPGGRNDRSVYADLNMVFTDFDYAGFAPSLQIKAGKTASNISRFTTSEVSVGIGIQSKF